jgi:hypothetical protein
VLSPCKLEVHLGINGKVQEEDPEILYCLGTTPGTHSNQADQSGKVWRRRNMSSFTGQLARRMETAILAIVRKLSIGWTNLVASTANIWYTVKTASNYVQYLIALFYSKVWTRQGD